MNEGEFKKRIKDAFTSVWQNEEEKLKAKACILVMQQIVAEAEKEFPNAGYHRIFKWFEKWFGKENPTPSHVYSELELKKMAYGIPIDSDKKKKEE